jgi:hypothetical protein
MALERIKSPLIGNFTADDSGQFSGAVSLPSDLRPGKHNLQLSSYTPSGGVLAIVVGFHVDAAPTQASILITGARSRQQPAIISISGTAKDFEGRRLTPWLRSDGQKRFRASKATIRVGASAEFQWNVTSPGRTSIYFARGTTKSNVVTLQAARRPKTTTGQAAWIHP